MTTSDASRRQFLFGSVSGLSSVWLALRWPAILAAQEHAKRAKTSGLPAQFQFFSPEDAVEVEAMAAQVIPSDDAPGAREAHVIYFIDRVLATFDRDKQPAYTQGLKDLRHSTQELLSSPEYGGNYNQTGWKLIGFEDQMTYHPPFGYYDSEYNKGR